MSTIVEAPPPADSPDYESIDVVRVVWGARWKVVIWMVAGAILAGLGSFLLRPVYKAQVVFAVATEDEQSGLARLTRQVPIAALAGFLGDPRGRDRNEALAILRSREFTQNFVRAHELLPRLFDDRWNDGEQRWIVDEDEQPTMWEAYDRFDRKIRSISEDRVTGIVTLSIDWHDPAEASQWANLLLREADSLLRDREIREAEKSLDYLRREREKTDLLPVRDAIDRLTEEQINRVMFARVKEEFAFRVIDPAAVPDEDDYVRPNRLAMAIVGGLLAAMVGAVVVVRRSVAGRRQRAATS